MIVIHPLHEPWAPFAYPTEEKELRVTVFVPSSQSQKVWVHYGDRYEVSRKVTCEMNQVGQTPGFDVYRADLVLESGRFQYLFEIDEGPRGFVTFGADGVGCNLTDDRSFQYAQILDRDIYRVPSWVSSAVCYEIFPDRYCRTESFATGVSSIRLSAWDCIPTSSTFLGGNLNGVAARLPYLHDLGINLIYLTPIFKSRSNHRYDTEDYYTVDPLLGTKADLINLVNEAHALSVRVVLDAVFNHTSNHFFAFEDAVRNGRNSEYWNWYFVAGDSVSTKPVNYETFANGIASMPKLNVAHPQVEAYLLDVAKYWIAETGIDGWRLDVANEVDHKFWRRFRDVVKSSRPDALIIGEIWHDPMPWLHGDQFDGVMNYRFRTVVEDFFVGTKISVGELAHRLDALQFSVPQPAALSNFNLVGSHDTERIFTLLNEDVSRYRLVLVLLLSWQGIPMIYYGDEIAMTGGPDPLCRQGMNWGELDPDHSEAFRTIHRLLQVRSQHTSLTEGTIEIDHRLASAHVLQYRRTHQKDSVMVTLNLSPTPLSLPMGHRALFSTQLDSLDCVMPGHAAIWMEG